MDVWLWTAVDANGDRGIIFAEIDTESGEAVQVMFIGINYEDAMRFEAMAHEIAAESDSVAELMQTTLDTPGARLVDQRRFTN